MKNQQGTYLYKTPIDPTVNQLHEFLRIPTYDYYLLKIKYHPLFNMDQIAQISLKDISIMLDQPSIQYLGYQEALCQKNCVFMDVGYDLFVDKLIGQSQLFPLKNNKYNYGKLGLILAVSKTPQI
jgi:hypothetical protein